jgi:hypothetical protein
MAQVPIVSVAVGDAVLIDESGQQVMYCMTVVDPNNQIFTGINGKDKQTAKQFLPDDLVEQIPIPGLGAIVLALPI